MYYEHVVDYLRVTQTPHWVPPPRSRRAIKFHVHVRLPAATSDAPLKIANLGTALPLFMHHIHDIGETAYFEFLRLKGSNSAIEADVCLSTLAAIHCP